MRFPLLLGLALLSMPSIAPAASFNCAKAHSPLEHAICDDAALSRIDEQLAKAYDDGLRKLGDGAEILRRAQRLWLSDLPDRLKRLSVAAVRSAFEERLEALQAIPDFPAPQQAAAGDTFRPATQPAGYDVSLRAVQPCPNGDDSSDFCFVPAQMIVRPTGKSDVLQVINMPAVMMSCRLEPMAQQCASGGLIAAEDYNFDGRADLAVASDEPGGYGAFGANVFLFDPAHQRFVYNPGISALTASLTFEVDKAHKQLLTGSKSGCCYHENTVYRVENDLPIPVSRHIEDATDASDKFTAKITDSRWVGGRWVDKVHYEK